MSQFALDYLLWVFVSALAVLQAAAAWSGLSGLLFARRWPRATLWVAAVTLIAGFAWFFGSAERNQPDTGLGLDGNTQALYSFLAIAAAATVTLLLSSAINHRWASRRPADSPSSAGVGRLTTTTFARALTGRVRALAGAED